MSSDEITSGEFSEPTSNQGKEGRQSKKEQRHAPRADLPDRLVDAIYNRIMEKLTDGEALQKVSPKERRSESCYAEKEDEEEIASQPPNGKRRKTTEAEVSDDINSFLQQNQDDVVSEEKVSLTKFSE